jgi:hypothetical protein
MSIPLPARRRTAPTPEAATQAAERRDGDRPAPRVVRSGRDTTFALTATALYAALVFVGLAHHAMWRDELQAWMIARDSGTIGDLFRNIRYEGHPPLWFLLLYVASRITRAPVAMQVLHGCLAAGAGFLFSRYAPLPRWQRVLFLLGYYPLFEYSVKSRSYVLGVICLFALCALHRPGRRGVRWPQALLLMLLCATTACGMLLAVGIGAAIAVEWFTCRARPMPLPPRVSPPLWSSLLLVAVTLVACAALFRLTMPPPDAYFPGSALPDDAGEAAVRGAGRCLVGLFVPMCEDLYVFQLGALNLVPWHVLLAGLGIGTIAAVSIAVGAPSVRRATIGLTMLAVVTAGMIVLTHRVYLSARHEGTLYLAMVAAFWLARLPEKEGERVAGRVLPPWRRVAGSAFISVALLVQAAAGIHLYALDLRRPYSMAPAVAAYLRDNKLQNVPLFGTSDSVASSVGADLDRPIHFGEDDRTGTFIVWDWARAVTSRDEILRRMGRFVHRNGAAVLIFDEPIEDDETPGGIVVFPLAEFTDAPHESDENYCLHYAFDPRKAT